MNYGYRNFHPCRNFGKPGDRNTWMRIWFNEDGVVYVTVKRSRHGRVTEKYEAAMQGACVEYGIDFSSIKKGDSITKKIGTRETPTAEALLLQSYTGGMQ